mmetsp:Transcript_113700/g.316630  ORF Transcript_113700/g.316630 Transcript_113700/m.316630 type:complete len:219 (-) Transcript_113700:218-874(-)
MRSSTSCWVTWRWAAAVPPRPAAMARPSCGGTAASPSSPRTASSSSAGGSPPRAPARGPCACSWMRSLTAPRWTARARNQTCSAPWRRPTPGAGCSRGAPHTLTRRGRTSWTSSCTSRASPTRSSRRAIASAARRRRWRAARASRCSSSPTAPRAPGAPSASCPSSWRSCRPSSRRPPTGDSGGATSLACGPGSRARRRPSSGCGTGSTSCARRRTLT